LIMETVVRYAIMAALLIAGILMMVSVMREDWMREEITIKYSSMKKVMNMSGLETPLMSVVGEIPDSAALEMKAHFGLRKTCFYYIVSGLVKPLKYFIPTFHVCIDNEFFSHPEKYGMQSSTVDTKELLKQEDSALNSGFICMLIALASVVVAVFVVVIKAIKWPIQCLMITVALCLLAAVCAALALVLIKTDFSLKEDFDRVKEGMGSFLTQPGGRKRRDDGSTGYGDQYPAPDQGYQGNTNENIKLMMSGINPENILVLLKELEMRESFGCPATLNGVAIGLLLLVSILSVFEFFQKRRSMEESVKYQNVAMT